MLQNRRRRRHSLPSFDMTPMIDCVFQLLIFFIVCTRFKQLERSFEPHLATDEGLEANNPPPPREQLTIYCQWDDARSTGQFAVAIGARGKKAVPGTEVALADIVPLDRDGAPDVQRKRDRYTHVHAALVRAIEAYIQDSGAVVEKLEISFAKDARVGASSGTAPWAFVALAIDGANTVNIERDRRREKPYKLTFKFVDAREAFRR